MKSILVGCDQPFQRWSRWARRLVGLTAMASAAGAAFAQTYSISTLAGGTGVLNAPESVAVDVLGNVYVSDTLFFRISKVSSGGGVTTLASGFSSRTAVAVDSATNVFVADTNNHVIKRVVGDPGAVTTIAGLTLSSGPSVPGPVSLANARFNQPSGIAVTSGGTIIYVADTGNHVIRKIDLSQVGNEVTTIAGTQGSPGSGANQFSSPHGLALNSAGTLLYVADRSNHAIRRIDLSSSNALTTFAGTLNVSGSTDSPALFSLPTGVAVNSSGNVYVTDNGTHIVRKITSGGSVSTIAGLANAPAFTDAVGTAARFSGPWGMAVDGAGNIYVGDANNQRVRKGTVVVTTAPVIGSQPAGATFTVGVSTLVQFSVSASGNPAVSYQWHRAPASAPTSFAPLSNGPSSGLTVSGVNSSTLSITGATLANNGDVFRVVVSNGVTPDATSSNAVLAVVAPSPPSILLQPQSIALPSGTTSTSFTVSATATPAITSYQWERSIGGSGPFTAIANGVSGGATFSGATTSTLNITGISPAMNGDAFRVVISNGTPVTSSSATLSVPPLFLTPPNIVFATGQGGTFTITATGNPTPTITLVSGALTGFTFTPGSGTASLSGFSNDPQSALFTLSASNTGGTTTQQLNVSVQAASPPTIISPSATTFTVGQFGLFHFQAIGSPTPNFSMSGQSLPLGVNFFSPTLSGTPLNADGSPLTYTVVATNSSGASTAQTFTLTILGVPPAINTNPANATANIGGNAVFTASASGTPTPTLRWQRQPSGTFGFVDLSESASFSGTTTGTLNIVNVDAFMGGDQFRLSATTSGGGTVFSLPATLLVNVGTAFTTLAGLPSTSGALDGTGTNARFNSLTNIATDSVGNIYVADTSNHVIRRVTAAGVVTTYAGFPGSSGALDGIGSAARFNSPQGVAVDSSGNVYVADTSNHTIRVISSIGAVTTLAGSALQAGTQDGLGSAARFVLPTALVVDFAGTIYVADSGNHSIRQVLSNGTVTMYAGFSGFAGSSDGVGTGARFNQPSGIARDLSGNLYVADASNHTIRKITGGAVVTTLAGAASQPGIADGNAITARFNRPLGVAVDSSFNVYVADTLSHTIRKVTSTGDTSTLAGSPGVPGSNDGAGSQARFNQPTGVAVDSSGNIYVADKGNHTIRKSGTPVAPTIALQPGNQTAPIGGTVSFTAAATGSPTPGFQWQRQPTGSFGFSNLGNDGTFSGVNTATLTITNVTQAMSGDQYRVFANNGVQPVAQSNAATLTVGIPPVFTSPTTASFQALQAGSFNVTVTSTPAATFSATGLPSWATINPTTGAITGTPPDTNGSPFTVTVSANNGIITTQTLTLIVTAAPPTIATHPASTTVDQGQNTTFTVTVTGTPPFNYQWRRNGAPIVGATGASLQLTNVQPSAAGTYSVVVSNIAGTATSNGATLNVNSFPVITSQPGPQVAQVGTSATFSVTAVGGNLSYQWRRNGVAIPGANGSTYTLNFAAATDAGNFDVVVSNPFGLVNSSLAQLAIVTGPTAPVITAQPAARSVVAGGSTTFMVGASGSPAVNYQWRRNGANVTGATNATLTLTNVQAVDAANYDVIVSNSAGNVTSSLAGLTVLGRSFAGIYFGSFSSNLGDFAMYVRDDNTGVFLGYLPASTTPVISLNFRINDLGQFSFTHGAIGIGGTINADGTFSGSIVGGVSGTFGGSRAPESGTQNVAGFYQAGSGVNAGTAYVIAGPNGVAFAVVQSGAVSDGGRGVVTNTGAVTVSTSRSVFSAAINAGTGTIAGSSNGAIVANFSGGSEATLARQRLVNISSRARVATGDAIAIAGFVISGEESKPVLIRAVGPTIGAAPFNVPGALAAPRLELFRGSTSLLVNTGITGNRAAIDAAGVQAGAFALGAAGTDAAILTTLAPGNYTAQVSSATNTAGVALVEVYDLSGGGVGQKMLNIATRASAGLAENTLIAGFVIPPGPAKRVLIRGVGPGLTPFGVTGVLPQPTLSLMSGATTVATNSNWSTSVDAAAITAASAQVGAFGLANADAAMILTLAPGNYTAQVLGAGGATGVALIEVYELP